MSSTLPKDGHALIAGATRTGKSRLVAYQVVRSFIADQPLCYIDPKGETYDDLLMILATMDKGKELWEKYKHRIILINPVGAGNVVVPYNAIAPLTPFASSNPDYTALLANSIVSHIRRQSGFEMAEANRMQNIMSAAIGLLVEGGKGELTLAELPFLFVTESAKDDDAINPFTARLLKSCKHYGTLSFWNQQWKHWTGNARRDWVQSTEGRIFQYLFDSRLLYSVCGVQTAVLDFSRLVEEGYWIFVKLPYQLMSDTVTMLMGNLLVSKLFYACMQGSSPDRPYRVILDEARFFNSGPLDVIMDTAGAYKLWLTLVVQNLDQMARSTDGRFDYRLRDSILGNCRYFAVFNDHPDSELFGRMMFPLTGQIAIGTRGSGDLEYLPVQAEENIYQRRFMELGYREVILYDKFTREEPRVWMTPDVEVAAVDRARVDYLETEQMKLIGHPALSVHQEIVQRHEKLCAEIGVGDGVAKSPVSQIKPPTFGGL